ncbi:ATPase [Bradyrhizobium yuanmingense]|uniref:F0F1 ATP synthase subunit B family protein n=1 Tax=Bradyrhizobium yuanmingense TaxID=108015 RepID=UPI001CD71332|nr:ATPase [Bradyrhizobium yuanmingense]MCA1529065.1 F0F1 ATP synthase subunit delta [Bradyrhizobium yuanmingense]
MTVEWWTVGLQAVNVTILVWLLARFFWRPVAGMIEERRTPSIQVLAEAEAKRNEANSALVDIERIRSGFDRERESIVAAAHEAAEQERKALLAVAAKEVATLEASAKMSVEKEQHAVEQAWVERASRLAVEIARRLVARLNGPAAAAAFLDVLLREIRSLPEPARKAMAADGVVLEVVSATPVQPDEQQQQRQLIAEALGARPEIAFKEDPGLIAGLELHGPHLVIKNSWGADLAKILADLSDDNNRH